MCNADQTGTPSKAKKIAFVRIQEAMRCYVTYSTEDRKQSNDFVTEHLSCCTCLCQIETTVRRFYHDPRPPHPIATIGWEKPAAGPWEIQLLHPSVLGRCLFARAEDVFMASKPKLDQTESVGNRHRNPVYHSASLSRTDVSLRLSNFAKINKMMGANWDE